MPRNSTLNEAAIQSLAQRVAKGIVVFAKAQFYDNEAEHNKQIAALESDLRSDPAFQAFLSTAYAGNTTASDVEEKTHTILLTLSSFVESLDSTKYQQQDKHNSKTTYDLLVAGLKQFKTNAKEKADILSAFLPMIEEICFILTRTHPEDKILEHMEVLYSLYDPIFQCAGGIKGQIIAQHSYLTTSTMIQHLGAFGRAAILSKFAHEQASAIHSIRKTLEYAKQQGLTIFNIHTDKFEEIYQIPEVNLLVTALQNDFTVAKFLENIVTEVHLELAGNVDLGLSLIELGLTKFLVPPLDLYAGDSQPALEARAKLHILKNALDYIGIDVDDIVDANNLFKMDGAENFTTLCNDLNEMVYSYDTPVYFEKALSNDPNRYYIIKTDPENKQLIISLFENEDTSQILRVAASHPTYSKIMRLKDKKLISSELYAVINPKDKKGTNYVQINDRYIRYKALRKLQQARILTTTDNPSYEILREPQGIEYRDFERLALANDLQVCLLLTGNIFELFFERANATNKFEYVEFSAISNPDEKAAVQYFLDNLLASIPKQYKSALALYLALNFNVPGIFHAYATQVDNKDLFAIFGMILTQQEQATNNFVNRGLAELTSGMDRKEFFHSLLDDPTFRAKLDNFDRMTEFREAEGINSAYLLKMYRDDISIVQQYLATAPTPTLEYLSSSLDYYLRGKNTKSILELIYNDAALLQKYSMHKIDFVKLLLDEKLYANNKHVALFLKEHNAIPKDHELYNPLLYYANKQLLDDIEMFMIDKDRTNYDAMTEVITRLLKTDTPQLARCLAILEKMPYFTAYLAHALFHYDHEPYQTLKKHLVDVIVHFASSDVPNKSIAQEDNLANIKTVANIVKKLNLGVVPLPKDSQYIASIMPHAGHKVTTNSKVLAEIFRHDHSATIAEFIFINYYESSSGPDFIRACSYAKLDVQDVFNLINTIKIDPETLLHLIRQSVQNFYRIQDNRPIQEVIEFNNNVHKVLQRYYLFSENQLETSKIGFEQQASDIVADCLIKGLKKRLDSKENLVAILASLEVSLNAALYSTDTNARSIELCLTQMKFLVERYRQVSGDKTYRFSLSQTALHYKGSHLIRLDCDKATTFKTFSSYDSYIKRPFLIPADILAVIAADIQFDTTSFVEHVAEALRQIQVGFEHFYKPAQLIDIEFDRDHLESTKSFVKWLIARIIEHNPLLLDNTLINRLNAQELKIDLTSPKYSSEILDTICKLIKLNDELRSLPRLQQILAAYTRLKIIQIDTATFENILAAIFDSNHQISILATDAEILGRNIAEYIASGAASPSLIDKYATAVISVAESYAEGSTARDYYLLKLQGLKVSEVVKNKLYFRLIKLRFPSLRKAASMNVRRPYSKDDRDYFDNTQKFTDVIANNLPALRGYLLECMWLFDYINYSSTRTLLNRELLLRDSKLFEKYLIIAMSHMRSEPIYYSENRNLVTQDNSMLFALLQDKEFRFKTADVLAIIFARDESLRKKFYDTTFAEFLDKNSRVSSYYQGGINNKTEALLHGMRDGGGDHLNLTEFKDAYDILVLMLNATAGELERRYYNLPEVKDKAAKFADVSKSSFNPANMLGVRFQPSVSHPKVQLDQRFANYIIVLKTFKFDLYNRPDAGNIMGTVLADKPDMLLAVFQGSAYAYAKYMNSTDATQQLLGANAKKVMLSCLAQLYRAALANYFTESRKNAAIENLNKAFEFANQIVVKPSGIAILSKKANQFPVIDAIIEFEPANSDILPLGVSLYGYAQDKSQSLAAWVDICKARIQVSKFRPN